MRGKTADLNERELRAYYQKAFPWPAFTALLCHAGFQVSQADVALSLRSGGYWRNKAYSSIQELREAVCKVVPLNLHVGPWYPDERRKDTREAACLPFLPVHASLRFDLDITDWGTSEKGLPAVLEYLKCSHEAGTPACSTCWNALLKPALVVLRAVLREVLGAKHFLVSSSGKKGAHLTVVDVELVRSMSLPAQREHLAQLFTEEGALSPAVRVAVYKDALLPLLRICLVEDSLLHFPLQLVQDTLVRQGHPPIPREVLERAGQPLEAAELFPWLRRYVGSPAAADAFFYELARQLFWPRIDAAVTRDARHLLKSVFSVHSSTRQIALPILDLRAFDPKKHGITLDMALHDPRCLKPHEAHVLELLRAAVG